MKNSLKRALIIFGSWKTALLLLIVSIIFKIFFNYYEDNLFQIKNNQFTQILKQKVGKLIEFSNSAKEKAENIYKEIDINAFTKGTFPKDTIFGNILFFSTDNTLIKSIKKPLIYNFESSERALRTLSYSISPTYLNEFENKSYYDISLPYFKDDQLQGVLSFSISLSAIFNELTANYNLEETGQLFIVQKNLNDTFSYIGPMVDDLHDIAPLYFKEINANISQAQIDALQGKTETLLYKNYKGIESLAVIRYIPELQFGIVIYSPYGLPGLISFLSNYILYFTSFLLAVAIIITCIRSNEKRKIFFYILDRGVILFLFFLITSLIINYRTQNKRQEEISFINLKEQASYFNQKINKTIESIILSNEILNNYIASNFSSTKSNLLETLNTDTSFKELINESFKINPIVSNILIGTETSDDGYKIQMLSSDFLTTGVTEEINRENLLNNLGYLINYKIDSEANFQTPLTPFYFSQLKNYYSGLLSVETIAGKKIIIIYLVDIDEFKKSLPAFSDILNGSAYIATSSELLFSTLTSIQNTDSDNLYSLGQETKSQAYYEALGKMRQNKTGFDLIPSGSNLDNFWLFYTPIEKINSYLLIFVSEDNVKIPDHEKNIFYNRIFLAIVLILCLIFGDFIHLSLSNKKKVKLTSIILTIIFIAATLFAIKFGQKKSLYFDTTNTLVNNKSIEYYMIDRENESADLEISQPLFLPISLFVEELYFTNDNDTFISGYVFIWYPQKILDLDIKRGFYFPDGNDANIELLESKKTNDGILEIYKYAVKFASMPDLKKYPFDLFKISFEIQPMEMLNNIIFVPNFDLYKDSDPSKLPGLDLTIESENLKFVRSYFKSETTGFQLNSGADYKFSFFNLSFNIEYLKNTITVFIVYLLPLLVIVVSTFAVLWMVVYGEFESMQASLAATGAYTALTFALIIMHTALRSKFESPSIIYLEALFFPTYTIIILLLVHSMFLNYKAKTISKLYSPKILNLNDEFIYIFWPLQTGLWFLITYYIFY